MIRKRTMKAINAATVAWCESQPRHVECTFAVWDSLPPIAKLDVCKYVGARMENAVDTSGAIPVSAASFLRDISGVVIMLWQYHGKDLAGILAAKGLG